MAPLLIVTMYSNHEDDNDNHHQCHNFHHFIIVIFLIITLLTVNTYHLGHVSLFPSICPQSPLLDHLSILGLAWLVLAPCGSI